MRTCLDVIQESAEIVFVADMIMITEIHTGVVCIVMSFDGRHFASPALLIAAITMALSQKHLHVVEYCDLLRHDMSLTAGTTTLYM